MTKLQSRRTAKRRFVQIDNMLTIARGYINDLWEMGYGDLEQFQTALVLQDQMMQELQQVNQRLSELV